MNPTVGPSQGAATDEWPRLTPPSAAGAPTTGPLAPQASTGQLAVMVQEAVSDNNHDLLS